jgi:Domain of unknown function (DUF4234)
MKKRNIFAVFALSIITLGMYMIYWLYRTRLDLTDRLQDRKAIPPVFILFMPLVAIIALAVVTAILSLIAPDAEGVIVAFTIVYILGILAAIVVGLWWFYRYFQALHKVTQGTDPIMLYVLWIALSWMGLPVWVIVVQNDLNKYIERGGQPAPVYPPQAGWQQPMPAAHQAPSYPQPGPEQHGQQWPQQPTAHPQAPQPMAYSSHPPQPVPPATSQPMPEHAGPNLPHDAHQAHHSSHGHTEQHGHQQHPPQHPQQQG